MKKIFIATIDCSVSEAIRYALAGHKIIVPETTKDGKPGIELINFTRKEAKAIYKEISNNIDKKARLVIKG